MRALGGRPSAGGRVGLDAASPPLFIALLVLPLLLGADTASAQARSSWRVGEEEPPAPQPLPEPAIAALALSIKSRAIQDSRCYLMNGGAVESFFISEDTPVGSVIGTLSVNGDPSEEQGDITLRLQERNAAVAIAPGSKNLTLLRALDREEKSGPSNVYVNVRCDRRRTTDPSFIIPVSVRVWDVNDNAPVWVGAPYRVRLSELSAVASRVPAPLKARDADQPGPHATLRYSLPPGPHSEYFAFPNELDSILVIKKPLDYETLNNFTVTLRASDGGSPPLHNDTQLHVEVLDADDQNPKFSREHYTALLPDDAREGTVLAISPEPISAMDQDLGIKAPLQYSATGDFGRLVVVDKDTGQLAATKQLIEELAQPITIVIKATQVDNADRYALATLTVSRSGNGSGSGIGPGVRFRRRHYSTAVSEAAPLGSVLLTLHTDPPHTSGLQFYVSDRGFLDKFAINSGGEVVLRRPLDYEVTDSYRYQVMVTDGVTNDTASINITVQNENEWEPRFRYTEYEFRLEDDAIAEDAELLPVGKLEVFDGDKAETVSLTLRGPDSSMLHVSPSGEVFVRSGALRALNSSLTVLHAVATATDSGAPPRQSSVPVRVHVNERLLRHSEGGVPVLALLGAAAAALALLVCLLLLYIYTTRRRSKRTTVSPGKGYLAHEKPHAPSPPAPVTPVAPTTPVAPVAQLRPAASSGSLLSVSAGASTILANSSSSLDLRTDSLPPAPLQNSGPPASRQSQRYPRSKVAPLAPVAPGPPSDALMSDHLQSRDGGRSGVAWPAATIPARVKKLSWDDAHDNKGSGGDSLADATNPAMADHMNLTVYF